MDKKIKPRKFWSVYSKPIAPYKPTPPNKTIVIEENDIISAAKISLYESISLNDLNIPVGVDFSTLSLVLVEYDEQYSLQLSTTRVVEQENSNYQQMMNEYNQKIKNYNIEKKLYKQELAEWKIWSQQEKAKIEAKNIEKAQKLLAKHGIKK